MPLEPIPFVLLVAPGVKLLLSFEICADIPWVVPEKFEFEFEGEAICNFLSERFRSSSGNNP